MPKIIMDQGRLLAANPQGPTDEDLVALARRGDPMAKNELLRRFSTTIRIKSSAYSKAPIPTAAIEGEAMSLLLYSIERFDPGLGLKFKTFLEQNLKGLYRYVTANKNIARISEHQALQFTRYNNAKEILQASKGREPTNDEIADSINWPLAHVQKMESALSRRSIASSGIEALHDTGNITSRMQDVMEFEYFSMMPEEKLVYDYSLGAHGKRAVKDVSAIAKASGLTTDKVYSIKRDLARKITSRI